MLVLKTHSPRIYRLALGTEQWLSKILGGQDVYHLAGMDTKDVSPGAESKKANLNPWDQTQC